MGASTSGLVARIQSNSTAGSGLSVLANGNVGIGTTAPPYQLVVSPGTGAGLGVGWNKLSGTGETDFYNYGQSGGGGFSFWNYSVPGTSFPTSGATHLMTMLSNGNVGIGTTAPSNKLDVVSGAIDIAVNPNTGLGAGVIGTTTNYPTWLIANGAVAESILPSGFIGVGTTSPVTNLHVVGSSVVDKGGFVLGSYVPRLLGAMNIFNNLSGGAPTNTGTTDPNVNLRIGSAGGAATDLGMLSNGTSWLQARNFTDHSQFYNFLINPNGGYVGIGTTAPGSPLTVAGVIQSTSGGIKFPDGTTQTTAAAGVSNSYLNGGNAFGAAAVIGTTDANTLNVKTNNVSRMFFDTSGNVGIGTTAPPYQLTVSPGSGAGLGVGWNKSGGAGETDFYNYGQGGVGGFAFWNYSSPGSVFPTTGAMNLMTITNAGNVGIGTTSPNAMLDVRVATNGRFIVSNTNDLGSPTVYVAAVNDANSLTQPMELNASKYNFANGNVGIGTTAPAYRLDVAGTIRTSAGGVVFPDGTTQTTAAGSGGSGQWGYTNPNVWYTAGNVGIGVNTPVQRLEVQGPTYSMPATSGSASDGTSRVGAAGHGEILDMGIGGGASWLQSRLLSNYSTNYSLLLNPNGGNVGIGTTAPGYPLHVLNSSNLNVVAETSSTTGYSQFSALADSATPVNTVMFSSGSGFGGVGTNSANDFVLRTGGAEKMRVASSGNVGVAQTAPSALFSVGIGANLGSLSSMSSTFLINNGNLGNSVGNEMAIASFGYGNSGGNQAALGVRAYRAVNGSSWNTSSVGIGMDVDNTPRAGGALWFNSTYVGVGTASPAASLHIARSSGVADGLPVTSGTTQTGLVMRLAAPSAGNSVLDIGMQASATGKQYIQATDSTNLNQTYPLLLNPNGGNIGIGTAAPSSTLEVAGTATVGTGVSGGVALNVGGSQNAIRYTGSNGGYFDMNTGGTGNFFVFRNGNSYSNVMTFSATNQVGVGMSPAQALDVNGNIRTNGCLYYASSSLGSCASDERIKKDIHGFDLGLDTILGLNPVFFKYNGLAGFENNGKEQIGVIAQQVEKVAPSLIKKQMVTLHAGDKEKTEIKGVDYGAFTYVIINSIKEFYKKWMADSAEIHRTIASHDERLKDLEQVKQENEMMKEWICKKDPTAPFCKKPSSTDN